MAENKKENKNKKKKNSFLQGLASFAESSDRVKSNYEENKVYECKFCNQQFDNGNKLDEHLKMH